MTRRLHLDLGTEAEAQAGLVRGIVNGLIGTAILGAAVAVIWWIVAATWPGW